MATPTHDVSSGVSRDGFDSPDPVRTADATEIIPRLSWFRKRRRKLQGREQQIIHRTTLALPQLTNTTEPPQPLDRGRINEAINKYGWIELP